MNKAEENKRNDILSRAFLEKHKNESPMQPKWSGGVRRFKDLSLAELQQLVFHGFIELDECQNNSPKTATFLDFMKKFGQVRAHGYAVSADRPDARVTLEGISCYGDITNELMLEFEALCSDADELTVCDKFLYAWWD